MTRKAVGLWAALMALCGTALLSLVLLVSGPVAAQTTGGTTGGTGAYGPTTAGSTVAPTTVAPVSKPAAVAFTGADIALIVIVAACAIGVGGTLVLVSRRRRSQQAEGQ